MEKPYRQIGIPTPLVEWAQELLEAFPELGYRNPSEFAVAAFREKLDEITVQSQRLLEVRGIIGGAGPGPMERSRKEGLIYPERDQ